ncbi:chitinase-like protein 3 [Anopheles funestus]|uniref:chitinase-like protein 3 n=1 Tax=Anopheles funestus TaxID=62324 RepID=UPI0020C66063|nr:chitinase-like protein 3 [Anopheles funestus]XP_049284154.1 chitinase-like protein 3 [Anopheles funestus]XP_049284163.1 chitinase-like protein 3 [Anopheles funestus]
MSKQQGKYELLKEDTKLRRQHTYIQSCLLIALCGMSSLTVYATWTMIFRQNLIIPPALLDVTLHWRNRLVLYEEALRQTLKQQQQDTFSTYPDNPPVENAYKETVVKSIYANNGSTILAGNVFGLTNDTRNVDRSVSKSSEPLRVKELDNERIFPSRFGNYIYSKEAMNGQPPSPKIVCYYTTPALLAARHTGVIGRSPNLRHMLLPEHIDPHLCTHLNIGIIDIVNNTLFIDNDVREALVRTKQLRRANPSLRILLWIGGGSVGGFATMVENHANRKQFIQSIKSSLELYHLDGVDLDWEFPDNGGKRRMHFSQLLHEIRREYQREHRTYILSVAVAPQETIAYMAYDVTEINNYADYVNLMTYDYHFYSPDLPQTGLNAPLYRRPNELALLGTLNINESVHYWLSAGLEKSKLILGLPTYGHTFALVNPFNTRIGAPASNYGRVGLFGFASYSEICWFRRYNIYVHQVYDVESCSPYMYSGSEWISYEDERSLECKAKFIKDHEFGGAMIFSLNTDDFGSYCADNALYGDGTAGQQATFPLLRKVRSVLVETNANKTVTHRQPTIAKQNKRLDRGSVASAVTEERIEENR